MLKTLHLHLIYIYLYIFMLLQKRSILYTEDCHLTNKW